MGRPRKRPPPPGADYPPEHRLAVAMAALGCPRGDKRHHLTEQEAQRHLDWVKAHAVTHDPSAHVYACPCGMGWVWGRPRRQ